MLGLPARASFAFGPGCVVLNEVVLNQVLFRFEDDESTGRDVARALDAFRKAAVR